MGMEDKDDLRGRSRDAVDDMAHSAAADKAKGTVNETVGKVKEHVGRALGDHELQAKGAIQQAEGKKDRMKGEIKEKIDDAKTKAKAGVEALKDKIDEARHGK
ncbi:MAG: CsbD family protein [Nevskia sp.]|nr:CsbD family protein [Nevskia sp.]